MPEVLTEDTTTTRHPATKKGHTMATRVTADASKPLPQVQIDTSTSDFLSQGLEELETGDDGSLESFGGEGTVDANDAEEFDFDGDLDADAEAEADAERGEEDAADSEEESDDSEDEEQVEGEEETDEENPDVLSVDVTDDQGRRTLSVDLKDKEGIKRYVQQAAGARKLYAKHQQVVADLKAKEVEIESLRESDASWNKLESIYDQDGIEGVVSLLEGKTLDQLLDDRVKFQETFKKMSPAEQLAYTQKRIEDRAKKEVAAAKAEVERMRTESTTRAEQAAIRALETVAHSEFAKVSFAGKLGDETREVKLDEMMWNGVQSELDSLEKSGVELTQEVVSKVVQDKAALLGATSSAAAQKKTSELVKKKKEAAKKAAQSSVIRGSRDTRRAAAKDVDPTSVSGMAALLAGAVQGGRKKKR